MSIPFSGTLTRSKGIISAITKQIKMINFKGVQRVTVRFDPFEEKANEARNFLFYISSPKINGTNPNCLIKTEIVCNREPPSVTFQLIPTVQEAHKIKSIKIDAANLSVLELLSVTNEHVSAKAPKEDQVSTIKTKSEKKSAGGARRK